ncbi:SH3 domain-containing protein [Ancylobacter pratisalsi]|uniref:SH3 domain-containing protein n=1 Tax=Ancylobacter pratisalsi TaxID=1745854 RepID=A0A6P1YV86_9HYPH|nr:SH3 domain-containing protein [Ancylobacter pratisalsi]
MFVRSRILPRSLALAFGLLVFGTVAALARPAIVTTDLNVRSGPGTRYKIVGALRAGQRVDVGQCTSGWCRVGRGYASSRYLSTGSSGAQIIVRPDYYDDDDFGYTYGPAFGLGWGGGYWGPWGNYGGPPRYYGRNYWGPNPSPGYNPRHGVRPPPGYKPQHGYRKPPGYRPNPGNRPRPPHAGGRPPGNGPRPGYRPPNRSAHVPTNVPHAAPRAMRPGGGGGGRPPVYRPGMSRH